MKTYNSADLIDAYSKLMAGGHQVVLVESDLAGLGFFDSSEKHGLTEAHLSALQKIMGAGSTLVVPTASPSLIGTDTPFSTKETPSERGIFSEYLRKVDGAIRSFHPFNSYTALGPKAEEICGNTSRHAYGPETPMGRMIEMDTLCISIGLKPHITCSTLHQIELVMGIPYRHTKEIFHPVMRSGDKVTHEPFYIHQWYEVCGIKKHHKKKMWSQYEAHEHVNEVSVGRGKIYSYSMISFYKRVPKLFNDDMYLLLEGEPEVKPYK